MRLLKRTKNRSKTPDVIKGERQVCGQALNKQQTKNQDKITIEKDNPESQNMNNNQN